MPDSSLAELSRAAEVMLYVFGTLIDIEKKGKFVLHERPTPKGISIYDQLKASGFRPTDEEVRDAMRYITMMGMARVL